MPRHELSPLSIAVRVYPHSMDVRAKPRSRTPWHCPDAMLVFDTETRTDAAQSMTFGSYRFIVAGVSFGGGFDRRDEFPRERWQTLLRWTSQHAPPTPEARAPHTHSHSPTP